MPSNGYVDEMTGEIYYNGYWYMDEQDLEDAKAQEEDEKYERYREED